MTYARPSRQRREHALGCERKPVHTFTGSIEEGIGNRGRSRGHRLVADDIRIPIIILTGYPSVRSAVACIELPVAAYLTKPVDFPTLLEKVRAAVVRFRLYQAMQRTESRLQEWREQMAAMSASPQGGTGVDLFLALTLRNVMGSLTDLEQLSRSLSQQSVASHPCQLLNCPRGAQLVEAVRATVAVLEETKGAFKSKTLGDLRHRLELLLEHV